MIKLESVRQIFNLMCCWIATLSKWWLRIKIKNLKNNEPNKTVWILSSLLSNNLLISPTEHTEAHKSVWPYSRLSWCMHRCSRLLRESRADIIWIDTIKISACLKSSPLYFAATPSCLGWHAKQKPPSKTGEQEESPERQQLWNIPIARVIVNY